MDAPLSDVPPAAQPPLQLDDLTCSGCGYSLRGLNEHGACPECGTSVQKSTRGYLLRFADVRWLTKLKNGTLCIAIYALAVIPMSILTSALMGYLLGDTTGLVQALEVLMSTAMAGVFVLGAVLVTTQEPRLSASEDPLTLRRVVRITAVVGFVGTLLSSVAGHSAPYGVDVPVMIIAVLFLLVWIVTFLGLFVHYRRLGERIPDPKLVKRTRVTMWGIIACYAVLTVMVTFMALVGPVGAELALGLSLCGIGVFLMAFLISTIVVLFKFHNAFARAIASAQQNHPATQPAG